MFKGFIPGKRVASNDLAFDIVIDPRPAHGKENRPQTMGLPNISKTANASMDTRRLAGSAVTETHRAGQSPAMEIAFDKLLNDLQIPVTLRPKLNGMEPSVKAAMLRSSQVLALGPNHNPPSPKRSPAMRRTRSSNSLDSPRHISTLAHNFPVPPESVGNIFDAAVASPVASTFDENDTLLPPMAAFMGENETLDRSKRQHTRGKSVDVPRTSPRANASFAANNRSAKDNQKDITPAKFCGILTSTSSTQLDVEIVKKLRLLLRNESAGWTQEFVQRNGYDSLLTRLNEILEVEWREEQHDDQILYELLRCLKALSTSSIGCAAIRSCSPAPFPQLVSLLYSDKKPGDLCTRQLIVELLLNLFDLYPPSSLPSTNSKPLAHKQEVGDESSIDSFRIGSGLVTLPGSHKTVFSFIRSLLLTQAPPPSENPNTPVEPHEFIESLHVPRIYKTYLQELSDICRDFFWIFCHPNNALWNLDDTDESKVEKPRAPGGMTGGVEFEAMGYLTTHFKFLNAVAKCVADTNLPKDHEHSAYRFHADLFASGIERIILVSRKASTTYYPTLHLEIARYLNLTIFSGYNLPYSTSRLIGAPPSNMCKPGRSPKVLNSKEKKKSRTNGNENGSPVNLGSPRRSHGLNNNETPKIPPPKQLEPIVW